MSAGVWFWLLLVLSVLFGAWVEWPYTRRSSTFLVLVILLALLGYRVFGGPVQ